jgi:protein-S-isoprenylcysteine O-methyltransferase Ste14
MSSPSSPSSPPTSERVATRASAQCPPSATHYGINCVGFAALLGAIYYLHGRPGWENQNRVLVLMAATALPVGLLDLVFLKVHRRASTGLDFDKTFAPNLERVGTKLLGLALTVGTVATAFWLFPEYHGGFMGGANDFYWGWFSLFRRFWPALVAIAIVYMTFVDGWMRQPKDTYWQLGRWVLGNTEDVVGKDVANHARGWLVKAFFLPLMMSYMHDSTRSILDFNLDDASLDNLRLYNFLYDGAFLVDLTFTTIGYILSLRLMDSHLRSAEPTMLGWIVALFCYQPFFSLMSRQYTHYDGPGFGGWLEHVPAIRTIWAVVVLLFVLVYILATVAFGWRFSNLTHRGILTNGPYRYTKHPAYVSKNISWWMSTVPWVLTPHTTSVDAIRFCVGLGLINVIYFLRARTEERHLSKDPDYVAYALWMNDHGAFAWLGRMFPFFRYVPPQPVLQAVKTEERAAAA